MRLVPSVVALLCLTSSVAAQRWVVSQKLATERVIGLLDLPDVTGNYADDACPSREAAGVPLFSKPLVAERAIGTVYLRMHSEFGCTLLLKRTGSAADDELPTEESGYEIAAAVVYEQRGRWFRIAIPRGSAWLQRNNADHFLPYPQLLMERMTYLRNDWDGQLWQAAGAKSPVQPLPVEWKEEIPKQIGLTFSVSCEPATTSGCTCDSRRIAAGMRVAAN